MSRSAAIAKAAEAARQLAEALAELATEGEASLDQYDSLHLPPRTTQRRFAEVCRSGRIPGARREGRLWMCSRTAWHGARAQAPTKEDAEKAPVAPTLTDRADELLRRQGLRFPSQGARAPGRPNAT